jgi:hypothetical protein
MKGIDKKSNVRVMYTILSLTIFAVQFMTEI